MRVDCLQSCKWHPREVAAQLESVERNPLGGDAKASGPPVRSLGYDHPRWNTRDADIRVTRCLHAAESVDRLSEEIEATEEPDCPRIRIHEFVSEIEGCVAVRPF